jgi:DNA-binding response OmpR family regulator
MTKRPRVLIIEDDLLIADMTEEILIANGYDVCGIATTVAQAIEIGGKHAPDIALIDYRLADGGFGTDAGAQLRATSNLGILYVTGNNAQVAMKNAIGDACLVKPYKSAELLQSLDIVAGIAATGRASPPFPRGFQLLNTIAAMPSAIGDD